MSGVFSLRVFFTKEKMRMNTQSMVMIPSWRYNKMVESYDKAISELESLKAKISELEKKSCMGSRALEVIDSE